MPPRFEEIESGQNALVKLVRSLEHRKHREEHGLFVSEGLEFATKAKAKDFAPHALFVDRDRRAERGIAEIAAWAEEKGARLAAASSSLLSRMTGKDNAQPVLLVVSVRWEEGVSRAREGEGAILALVGIRNPGNLGTILRTAEATGVSSVVLVGETCDPFSPEAVRASMGSVFAVRLTRRAREDFLLDLRGWPGDTVALAADAGETFRRTYAPPVLLVLGGESEGLDYAIRAGCRTSVRIPMVPGVDSLNVAAAAAVMLYEVQLPFISSASPTRW